jgi:hypothetical protein
MLICCMCKGTGTEHKPEECLLGVLCPGILHAQFLLQTAVTELIPLPLCFNMTQATTTRHVGSRMN